MRKIGFDVEKISENENRSNMYTISNVSRILDDILNFMMLFAAEKHA